MKITMNRVRNAITGFARNLNAKKWRSSQSAAICVAVTVFILCIAAAAANSTNTPRTFAKLPAETKVTFDSAKNRAYTAEDGIIVIPAPAFAESLDVKQTGGLSGDLVTDVRADTNDNKLIESAGAAQTRYTLPQDAMFQNGSLGILTIPKIGVIVNVYETDDEMEAMTKGLAHFKTTSAYDGNVGLCGHNVNFDGSAGYFYNLHKLTAGDIITYKTRLGKRTYTVQTVKEIPETDWSGLRRTEDDRVTLITCVTGKPTMRLMVQAAEKTT